MAEVKVIEIIKRETINPSSSTPPDLKIHKLSLLDQFQPEIYGQVIYFYQNTKNDINIITTNDQKSHQLKKSLSETLTRFYPIAGRINNNTTAIDCNDEGALYIEARFHGLDLSTFLQQELSVAQLQHLLASESQSPESNSWPQLLVQATFFDCGGLALGICLSHKSCDATSMGIFMKSWAEISNESPQKVFPVFNAASYFPPIEISDQRPALVLKKVESVVKRFVFEKQKLVKLKAETASESVDQPTRVEVVTALIWKCFMAASTRSSNPNGVNKFALTQSMNIRKRVDPPLPEHLVGNVIGGFIARMELGHDDDDDEVTLKGLVALLRNGIREYAETKAKKLRENGACEVIGRDMKETFELFGCEDTKVLIFTSLCSFELYKMVDFGWGKPIWVTVPAAESHSNVIILMDTKEGGVEATVSLTKEDMALFETDPQLLAFAYPSTLNSQV